MGVPKSARQQLLEEAIKITTSDRNKQYGNPEDNFKNIAELWNAYIRTANKGLNMGVVASISPADVAIMMALMKIARLATNPGHHDSAVDVAGYMACLADIQETMKENKYRGNLINKPHQPIDGVTFAGEQPSI